MNTNAGNLKKGEFVLHAGDVWQVVRTDFNFQGRGMATVRIKIKSTTNAKNIELTVKSVAAMDRVEVENRQMQYLYADGTAIHFMDPSTYNQIEIPQETVGSIYKFFKAGDLYFILLNGDKPLAVRPPATARLKVTETQQAVKGDTVSGAKKSATLETGVTVMVPLFIKTGDTIAVNPESGEYVERVKG